MDLMHVKITLTEAAAALVEDAAGAKAWDEIMAMFPKSDREQAVRSILDCMYNAQLAAGDDSYNAGAYAIEMAHGFDAAAGRAGLRLLNPERAQVRRKLEQVAKLLLSPTVGKDQDWLDSFTKVTMLDFRHPRMLTTGAGLQAFAKTYKKRRF